MAKLIVCADDYAQSPAINTAILALIEQGVLSATSCMTLSPHWPAAASALTPAIRTRADIGLHLDFTQFSQHLRLPHPQLVLRSLLRCLPPQKVRANITQQLDAFEQAMGTPPDYIDGHLHVHQLPVIRTALLDAMQQRYAHLPASKRPWLRISSPPPGSGFKARMIHWLGANALQTAATQAGFAVSPALLGVYDFSGDRQRYQQLWQHWLTQLQALPRQCASDSEASDNDHPGILPPVLMCHPAYAIDDDHDPIALARVEEWHCLQSASFLQWLAASGVHVVKGHA